MQLLGGEAGGVWVVGHEDVAAMRVGPDCKLPLRVRCIPMTSTSPAVGRWKPLRPTKARKVSLNGSELRICVCDSGFVLQFRFGVEAVRKREYGIEFCFRSNAGAVK